MRFLFRLTGSIFAILLILVLCTALVSFIRHAWFEGKGAHKDHVAVMDVTGVLLNANDFVKDLDEHVKNKSTKAIVIRVNSPGGIVAPSQEMYEAVKRADQKVPVYISMGSVAASGGYYLSLGARRIFANPGTLTASIGVIMEFVNTEKLYQWAKVDRFSITSGKFKDAGSPFKPMKPEERELFTLMINDIYRQFRDTVRSRRKLSETELESTTDGRVMTGRQALEARLVDELGGSEDAIREAKKAAHLPEDAPVLFPEEDEGLLRKTLLGKSSDSRSAVGAWLALARLAAVALETTAHPSSPPTAPLSVLPGLDSRSGWQVLWLAPIALPMAASSSR